MQTISIKDQKKLLNLTEKIRDKEKAFISVSHSINFYCSGNFFEDLTFYQGNESHVHFDTYTELIDYMERRLKNG